MALIDNGPQRRRFRRRPAVFFATLVPVLIASLLYVYLRPAEYRAIAQLQITPAAAVSQPTEAKDTPTVTAVDKSFLTEVQVLTSRPLLQDVLERLKKDHPLPELGRDPIGTVQGMLQAEVIAGTQIVELSAVGRDAQFVAALVNAIVDAYRRQVVETYKGEATGTYSQLSGEVDALNNEVVAKRRALDAFRARYDIVSLEHKENDLLAEIDGFTHSYTEANDRLAKAQAHVQAVQAAIATGQTVDRAKDDPTLADLERRASILREQLGDLQRRFTPDYLALDPDVRSAQARLDNLEKQLSAARTASAHAALVEAQEELSAAQAAVGQLRQDVADHQKLAREFTGHLNEYKTLQEDLDHLEGMHRAALDRLMKLQASEAERAPRVSLIEAAVPSAKPWRPNYQRDALIAVAGSLILALFVTWLADFISGAPASPPLPLLMQHMWAPAMLGRDTTIPTQALAAPAIGQLPAPEPLPRELSDVEIVALLGSATDDARLVAMLLLMGVSIEEIVGLRHDAIDLSAGIFHVVGSGARTLPLQEPLLSLLAARQATLSDDANTGVLRNAQGAPLAITDVERLLLFAAYDAGLDRPQEVTPAALRYTYLAYLFRQGIRAADIAEIAGAVPQNEMIIYMQTSSPTERRSLAQIDRVLPALRKIANDRMAK